MADIKFSGLLPFKLREFSLIVMIFIHDPWINGVLTLDSLAKRGDHVVIIMGNTFFPFLFFILLEEYWKIKAFCINNKDR
jgi:hypothetical protein